MGKKIRKVTGLRLRGEVYYADTRVKGIRLSQRIGKVNESTAKAILAKLISDVWEEQYFPKKVEKIQNDLFLVIACRWHKDAIHSYPVGIFNNFEHAKKIAHEECQNKNDEYSCRIYPIKIDEVNRSIVTYSTDILPTEKKKKFWEI